MPTLETQYQKVIDDQRAHLMKLQASFKAECEAIKNRAKQRLEQVPKENKEERQAIFQEEKDALAAALKKLKKEIRESTRATMKRLEKIQQQREAEILAHLERQLAQL